MIMPLYAFDDFDLKITPSVFIFFPQQPFLFPPPFFAKYIPLYVQPNEIIIDNLY